MSNTLQVSRKYGIDLLRIISMMMIVTLHTLRQGGILFNTEPFSEKYYAAWILYIFCIGAVNCYALISGYVGVDSKPRYYKIAVLWLQVLFYCVLFLIVYYIQYSEKFVTELILNQFFPVSTEHYWYFTAYFIMFFFTPFYNILLNSISKGQMKALGLTIFLLISVLPTVWQTDLAYTNRGYSFLWLSLLYLLGGIAKRLELEKAIKNYQALIAFVVLMLASAGFQLSAEYFGWKLNSGILTSYDSPTVLAATFCLFLFFAKLDIKAKPVKKVIGFLAPLSFSVYLIHTNFFIWRFEMKDRFQSFLEYPTFKMLGSAVLAVFAIYFICSAIDVVRFYLFKWLKIAPRLKAIEDRIKEKHKNKIEKA